MIFYVGGAGAGRQWRRRAACQFPRVRQLLRGSWLPRAACLPARRRAPWTEDPREEIITQDADARPPCCRVGGPLGLLPPGGPYGACRRSGNKQQPSVLEEPRRALCVQVVDEREPLPSSGRGGGVLLCPCMPQPMTCGSYIKRGPRGGVWCGACLCRSRVSVCLHPVPRSLLCMPFAGAGWLQLRPDDVGGGLAAVRCWGLFLLLRAASSPVRSKPRCHMGRCAAVLCGRTVPCLLLVCAAVPYRACCWSIYMYMYVCRDAVRWRWQAEAGAGAGGARCSFRGSRLMISQLLPHAHRHAVDFAPHHRSERPTRQDGVRGG